MSSLKSSTKFIKQSTYMKMKSVRAEKEAASIVAKKVGSEVRTSRVPSKVVPQTPLIHHDFAKVYNVKKERISMSDAREEKPIIPITFNLNPFTMYERTPDRNANIIATSCHIAQVDNSIVVRPEEPNVCTTTAKKKQDDISAGGDASTRIDCWNK